MVHAIFSAAHPWRAGAAEMKPFLLLVGVMTVIAGGIGATMLGILYHTAFEEQRERLLETVRCTSSVLKASAALAGTHPNVVALGGTEAAVLALIQEAHTLYERAGEGAELMLGKRRGADIVFLLRHSHSQAGHEAGLHTPVPFDSHLAEPMHRALKGQSGSMVGLDHHGIEVLAAYAPIATLGFGVVTKIDLSAIRAPFFRAGGDRLRHCGLAHRSGRRAVFSASPTRCCAASRKAKRVSGASAAPPRMPLS